MGRHVEQSLCRPVRSDCLREGHAITPGHHHVQQHQIHSPSRLAENFQRFVRAVCLQHSITLFAQDPRRDPPSEEDVVHHEHSHDLKGDPQDVASRVRHRTNGGLSAEDAEPDALEK